MVITYINNANILCYNINMKGQQCELGSSLPIVGGGDTMTLFEVLMLLIQFGLLVVAVLTYMQM
ncbi:putative holin-like toxin [Veillonella sp. VA142]|uniref:putative holin-like toxin n=1 Tax=Veillonella sp. VA142 TaxID=741834 RepID=UPI00352A8EAB